MKSHIKKWSRWGYNRSLGLLLIRVAVGMIFFAHGWMKIHNMPGIIGFFEMLGLPAWTAYFIAWLEVIGGAAMILGIATRIFAKLFAIEMIVAIFLTGIGAGYQRHEMEIALALISAGILFAGSGRYSLWSCECRDCGGIMCDDHKQSHV
jgi:putative oxidoreductase